MIIGLSGYAQTGKDTIAQHLVNEHGFTRIAFADPIREALYALNPKINDIPSLPGMSLSWLVDRMGWESIKQDSQEVRGYLQRMGTEVARNQWGNDFWVDLAMKKADDFGNVVITDVRFPNEYNAIKYRNGQVWRVNKLNHGPANDHPSEIALDDFNFDWSIPNYGTIEDLHAVIDGIMKS